jgi:hypothetical protein
MLEIYCPAQITHHASTAILILLMVIAEGDYEQEN